MALILCLETSSINCSVALFKDGILLAYRESAVGFAHAEKLHPFIQEVMSEANKDLSELSAVMVGAGPGSFTGLRIGSAAAKGLCFALSIPLLSFSSLKNMAMSAQGFVGKVNFSDKYIICPMIDARRMEVYVGQFDQDMNLLMEDRAEILNEDSFKDLLEKNTIVFCGDGIHKIRSFHEGNPKAVFIDSVLPTALTLGSFAEEKFNAKDIEDTAYYEPFYLKGFYATTPKNKV